MCSVLLIKEKKRKDWDAGRDACEKLGQNNGAVKIFTAFTEVFSYSLSMKLVCFTAFHLFFNLCFQKSVLCSFKTGINARIFNNYL